MQATTIDLLTKYDVPTPRYTSYPTVPQWELVSMTSDSWAQHLAKELTADRRLSLYLHLPYCEQLCTYCGCNKRITVNHSVEGPYIRNLLHEWELYKAHFKVKPVLDELHLGGGTPTFFSPANLEALLTPILSDVVLAENASLSVEVHPNVTTRAHLETLAKLGFKRISVGIQDFDPTVQAIINRHQTFEQTANIFNWARELGFTSINADLVYGLPLQTKDTIRSTFEQLGQLRPDRISFYAYAHIPWKSKGQRRYDEADLPAGAEKRALYELGRDRLAIYGYHEIGMDHFTLESDELYIAAQTGTLHRNFMGYMPRKTDVLIGLGASSISDTGNAYAQNHHQIEVYTEALQHGFPVMRGHQLSAEDLELKAQILNIICQLKTDWSNVKSDWLDGINDRLADFEAEGLIIRSGQSLVVTESGRTFLRHICQAFDARQPLLNTGGQIYSKGV